MKWHIADLSQMLVMVTSSVSLVSHFGSEQDIFIDTNRRFVLDIIMNPKAAYGFVLVTWGSRTSCKHNNDILLPYNVGKMNMLANLWLFTHPVHTQQHYHSFGVMFGFT